MHLTSWAATSHNPRGRERNLHRSLGIFICIKKGLSTMASLFFQILYVLTAWQHKLVQESIPTINFPCHFYLRSTLRICDQYFQNIGNWSPCFRDVPPITCMGVEEFFVILWTFGFLAFFFVSQSGGPRFKYQLCHRLAGEIGLSSFSVWGWTYSLKRGLDFVRPSDLGGQF